MPLTEVITAGTVTLNNPATQSGDYTILTVSGALFPGVLSITNGVAVSSSVLALTTGGTILTSGGGSFTLNGLLNAGVLSGVLDIGTQGTITEGSLLSGSLLAPVTFSGTNALLNLNQTTLVGLTLGSPIQGFAQTDTIHVAETITSIQFNSSTDTLSLFNGATPEGTLTFTGSFAGKTFTLTNNHDITLTPSCFVAGTRIMTASGEVAVEDLSIGDMVRTANGALRAVRWIGRRSYDSIFAGGNRDVRPVRLSAGALADGIPARDLRISPHHALYIDGVLIEARHLVNGASIVQESFDGTLAYYNVELDAHDVMLAEGTPVESFIDLDTRRLFHNWSDYVALYGAQTEPMESLAPRHHDGIVVDAVRRRIATRAGLPVIGLEAPVNGTLFGGLERVTHAGMRGWVVDGLAPDRALELEILVDGETLGRVVANRPRADVAEAGLGGGACGFEIELPEALLATERHVVRVRLAANGMDIPASPCVLDRLPGLDGAGRQAIGAAIAAEVEQARDAGDLDAAAGFLMAQVDALLQAKADLAAQRTRREARRADRPTPLHASRDAA